MKFIDCVFLQIRIIRPSVWAASSRLLRRLKWEMTSDCCIPMEVFASIKRQESKLSWPSSANQVGWPGINHFSNIFSLFSLISVWLWCRRHSSYTFLLLVFLQEIWRALLSFVAFRLTGVCTSWSGTLPPPASSPRRRETTARWRTLRLVRHKRTSLTSVVSDWSIFHLSRKSAVRERWERINGVHGECVWVEKLSTKQTIC